MPPATRTATEIALDALATPAPHELIEDNYVPWRRNLELTLLSAGFECVLVDELEIPVEFPASQYKKLLAATMAHIIRSVTQSIIHSLSFKATDKPKTLLDQIEADVAEDHQNRHAKLRMESERLVRSKERRGIDQYINGLRKVRRKMIQCNVPNVTDIDEKATVRMILM